MTHPLLWILSWFLTTFIGCECVRYSRFDIAISFANSTTKLSTSIFNLSVANHCVGGLPSVDDGAFKYHRVYQGDLVRLKWHSVLSENRSLNNGCFLSRPTRLQHSSWIAVIIEDKSTQVGCLQFALLNHTTSLTDASAILFLHDGRSTLDFLVTKASFSPSSSPPLRHELDQRQRRGDSGVVPVPPLLVSLPMDMFPDLPAQLAVASTFPQVAVTGDIELFAEPPSLSTTIPTATTSTTSDLSSSLLLLLIVCILFLLLGILLVPARLGICFWHRLCFLSFTRSSKSRRLRKLNAATRKALKQLPVKCLNQVDPLISEGFDQCAICIEVFKPQDLIRSLPCRHMYHRACIDPWLLKHRSCPLCKQNILIACGLSLAEEDVTSCSATTSEVNSGSSLSATSASPSASSISVPLEGLFCPLLVLFSCRRRRHHHHHFYRDFQHARRPSSSLDDALAPSGDRRVLGSASENSSSSITARSVPSDLFHTSAISPSVLEKGTRFPAEEFDEANEEGESMEEAMGRRSRRNFISFCSCCGGKSVRVEKEVPVERLLPPQMSPSTCGTTLPSALMYTPPVAHPPAMILCHLPHSMDLNQIPMGTKTALPSYEQATAMMPRAAFVALPASPPAYPHQPVAGWSPHFSTEPRRQGVAGLFDPPQRALPGAKSSVVYPALSTSAAKMSANSGVSPAPILCSSNSKLPIFVDVNTPKVKEAFGGQCQCPFPSPSPPLVQTRESSPPAYPLATVAASGKPTGTSLHPLRRVARLLATRLLSSPMSEHQQLRYRHYTSFLGSLKNYQHHWESKHRLNPRPRCLYEASTSATAIGTATTAVMSRHHRLHGYHRVGVLAKTLELNHEGVIMSSRSTTPSAIIAGSSPLPLSHSPLLSGRTASQRCTPALVSESSSENTHRAPLRHTRVHSVRVTVEPQVQYHTERDAASCEALHNANLHSIESENSLPRMNSLPISLKSSVSTGADATATVAAVAAFLWRCHPFGSAPAICSPISSLTKKNSSSLPSLSLSPPP
ncbi:RING finger protein [Echinococcus granulosus]|uniref:Ring finger protein 150 n=1 Tax=Echinococcus granulosus TaxID=6210 RepID=A0A068W8P5_ECHGR|nr:RING finger protein [Echinococcus granulosus]CDS16372.1 ring finger protein 150 [Echinococcus granulosus]